jgi:hypothetical protein
MLMDQKKARVLLEQLRAICLGLPEATEIETWGNPTFRVRNKIFAMYRQDSGHPDLWCKAHVGVQEDLVQADSRRFFVPPYVGHRGWIGVRLEGADWDLIADLVQSSYRMTAPKRLLVKLEQA